MFDVVVDGLVIARAENITDSKIYELNFLGLKNREICEILNVPLKSVVRLTEGGSTR